MSPIRSVCSGEARCFDCWYLARSQYHPWNKTTKLCREVLNQSAQWSWKHLSILQIPDIPAASHQHRRWFLFSSRWAEGSVWIYPPFKSKYQISEVVVFISDRGIEDRGCRWRIHAVIVIVDLHFGIPIVFDVICISVHRISTTGVSPIEWVSVERGLSATATAT